jgi:rhodanese-related sulfurtransferase
MILTGKFAVFADQTVQVRQEIIQSWATAKIPIVRLLFKSLTLLVKQTWAKTSMLLHDMIGMPRIPVHGVPTKSFDYNFLQIPPGEKPEIIETDVIVVGSGIGGGIAAKNLSDAGYNVIVVDKGYHWSSDHFPMVESEGWVHLFHNGGFLFCKLIYYYSSNVD